MVYDYFIYLFWNEVDFQCVVEDHSFRFAAKWGLVGGKRKNVVLKVSLVGGKITLYLIF